MESNNNNNKNTLYINPVDSEFSFFVKPNNINTNSVVNNNSGYNGTSMIIAQPRLQSPPGFSETDIKNNIKASNNSKLLSTSSTLVQSQPPDQAAQFQLPSPLLRSKEFDTLMDEFSKFDLDTSLNNSGSMLSSTPLSSSLPPSLNFMEDMNHLFDNPPPPVNFSYYSIGQSGITDFFNSYSSLMDNNYYSTEPPPINTTTATTSSNAAVNYANNVVVGGTSTTTPTTTTTTTTTTTSALSANIIDNPKVQIKNSNYIFIPTIQQQLQPQAQQPK